MSPHVTTLKVVTSKVHPYTCIMIYSSVLSFFLVRPRLGEVRLVPQDNDLGIVEVVYGENNSTVNKTWTRVCGGGSSSYDKFNALTICSQLGYTSVLNYDTM